MRRLFALQASNTHQALLAGDLEAWQRATADLNRDSLIRGWRMPALAFRPCDRRTVGLPEICTVYIPGALAFRADLLDLLMPNREGLEFLPLGVGSQPWLLVNCLNLVDRYDEAGSKVMRDSSGHACLVLDLAISDSQAVPELFTLTRSNRAQLFVTETFKTRVERLGLQGIGFKPMGRPVRP